jgi:hypothetical protein
MSAFRIVGTAAASGLLVLGLWHAGASHRLRDADGDLRRPNIIARLGTKPATFEFHPQSGLVTMRTSDGLVARDAELFVVVDGRAVPLTVGRTDVRARGRDLFGAAVTVDAAGDSLTALLDLRVDPASDALLARLSVSGERLASPHDVSFRVDVPVTSMRAFVSGVGELGDLATVTGKSLVIDDPAHPLAVASGTGAISVGAINDDTRELTLRLAASAHAQRVDAATRSAIFDLRLLLGASPGKLWGRLFALQGEPTLPVRGVVTGSGERAHVFGLDEEGSQIVRLSADADGRFEADVPKSVVQWYAALDPSRTSAPLNHVPGSPWELRLDVSPGGEVHVRIADGDTGKPIVARLLVRGVDGTRDPSFGPDYRASGAGPIIDSLHGEVTTPLPAGRYRVSATKGIEWSIDSQVVDVAAGHTVHVSLSPRHVVPTPRLVGCDLHVHARPSFDSPVTQEDRVLSLVSAGVDFAIPSEHNIVGDYTPSLRALDLANQLAFVTGVEVTTYSPRIGHFHVFPYPLGPPPPYRATSVGAIFAAARKGDPDRVLQVNHPRLPKAIGYFDLLGYDPAQSPPRKMRVDFDAIEVYSGFDLDQVRRVEAVLRDFYALLGTTRRYAATGSSDSHRIQYHWAGYPRTMARVDEAQAGDTGAPIDTKSVVAAVKNGRSFVTSGPMIFAEIAGAQPGDEAAVKGDRATVHVVVRAAPWVDVTSVEVVAQGEVVATAPVPPRPPHIGAETGSADEAAARTVRLDKDIEVPLKPGARWLLVVARGERPMDDVLPFMPVIPFAFTNPIWLAR